MNPVTRLHDDERGVVAPVTIALVALLFLGGVAMALAVESNLRTVGQIRDDNATHYAAESAVARGVAAGILAPSPPEGPCGSRQPPVNDVQIATIECHSIAIDTAAPGSVKQWAVSPASLPADIQMDLGDLGKKVSIWTVVAPRRLNAAPSNVRVWINNAGDITCPQSLPAGPNYYKCLLSLKGKNVVTLHVGSEGGPVNVGPFVVRAAEQGSVDFVVTVIGRAGSETDHADVLLHKGGKPVLGLWGTVLP